MYTHTHTFYLHFHFIYYKLSDETRIWVRQVVDNDDDNKNNEFVVSDPSVCQGTLSKPD